MRKSLLPFIGSIRKLGPRFQNRIILKKKLQDVLPQPKISTITDVDIEQKGLIEFVCKISVYVVFVTNALLTEKAQRTYSAYNAVLLPQKRENLKFSELWIFLFKKRNSSKPYKINAKVEMQMKKRCWKSYPLSEFLHPITRRGIASIAISFACNISRR